MYDIFQCILYSKTTNKMEMTKLVIDNDFKVNSKDIANLTPLSLIVISCHACGDENEVIQLRQLFKLFIYNEENVN